MDNYLVDKYRTLGIIALIVIIAMVLITSFTSLKMKKDFGFKSKKVYSDLLQGLQYSINNNDTPSQWGLYADDLNVNAIRNNILASIRVSNDCLETKNVCSFNGYYKNLSNKTTRLNLSKVPSVVLSGGTSVSFVKSGECRTENESCLLLYIDLNNVDPPNIIGKDLIVFELLNNQATYFKPYGLSLGYSEVLNNKKYGCSKKASEPLYCSALLFSKGWQYDKSYPW